MHRRCRCGHHQPLLLLLLVVTAAAALLAFRSRVFSSTPSVSATAHFTPADLQLYWQRRRAWQQQLGNQTLSTACNAAPHGGARFDLMGPVGPACLDMERYGLGDGEKRACGLAARGNHLNNAGTSSAAGVDRRLGCTVLSVGSRNEWSFEQAVAAQTPCDIVTIDCTITPRIPPALQDRVRFLSLCLGTRSQRLGDREFVSWGDLLRRVGVSSFAHVKLDIEGSEVGGGFGGAGWGSPCGGEIARTWWSSSGLPHPAAAPRPHLPPYQTGSGR